MHLLEKNDSLSSVDLTRTLIPEPGTAGHHLVTYRVNGGDVSDHKDVVFARGVGKAGSCLTRQDLLDGGVSRRCWRLCGRSTACVDLAAALPDSDPRFDFKHQILDLQVPQAMIKHARGICRRPTGTKDQRPAAELPVLRFTAVGSGSSDSSSGKQSDNYLNLTSGLNRPGVCDRMVAGPGQR